MNKIWVGVAFLFGLAWVSLAEDTRVKSEDYEHKYFKRGTREYHENCMKENFEKYKQRGLYKNELPNILVIGDSVTIRYSPALGKAFRDKANIIKNADNAGATGNGVKFLDVWLNYKAYSNNWSVIHFNFGLHDTKTNPTTKKPFTSLEKYEENLRFIVARLKKTDAKLIFATTTPFGGSTIENPKWLWFNEDIVKYNAVAIKVMNENGIEINDLYSHIKPKLQELQCSDGVHFADAGSDYLAQKTIQSIQNALKLPSE